MHYDTPPFLFYEVCRYALNPIGRIDTVRLFLISM